MRLALALLLLLTPGAAAWSARIDAPARADEGASFAIEVCADGEVRIMAEGGALDVREDRYLPAGCRLVNVSADGDTVRLEARVRPPGGSAIKARAFANVTIERAEGGLVLLDARAPPLGGFLVENVGDAPARLALRTLAGARLPENATLAPGELAFLGPRAPPDAPRFIPFDAPVRAGPLELKVGARVESALDVPKLRPGEGTAGRYGRTALGPESFDLAGGMDGFATPGRTPIADVIDGARDEALVASHTLTSVDVAAALARAADRGVRVRVLLEGAPPGGIPPDERALVATLQARGVEVLLMGGEGARYRTMHAKLVVVDRSVVVVSTENLNEGRSRGFGLVVADAALAAAVARVMDADAAPWHDITEATFAEAPADVSPTLAAPAAPVRWAGPARATLVLSPDHPRALAEAAAAARVSLDAMMLRADAEGPMPEALFDAARAGARVRVLLDARFDDGTNRESAARWNAQAAREGLALEARLAYPEVALHAKMFVVDGATSYVGSMNWVRPAWEDNREAGLLVESEAVAAWLEKEFERDWAGPGEVEVPGPAPAALVMMLAWLSGGLRRRARPRRA